MSKFSARRKAALVLFGGACLLAVKAAGQETFLTVDKSYNPDVDPSWKIYQERKEFLLQHEYLLQYGVADKDTDMELTEGEETAGASIQPPLAETVNNQTGNEPAMPYRMEQLADYDFMMKHFYNVHSSTTASRDLMNAERFMGQDLRIEKGGEPEILIYHTHSQETYADYGPDHPDANVIGIGNVLTALLQEKGYQVIHDTTVYDLRGNSLDRNKAYTYALEGLSKNLQEHPSIQVVVDLHRDGVKEGVHLVSEIEGKPTAPIMFFNGMSQTPTGPIEYLPNPYREENLAFSFQLQMKAAAYYPGLTRKIYLKGLRYNLHLRPRSLLIEVGAQTNTGDEAKNAMKPLAEVLDMVLQGN